MSADEVVLRPVTVADAAFLARVFRSSREHELAWAGWDEAQVQSFVRMQVDAQDRHFRQHHPEGSFQIVEVGGQPAGRLYVDRQPTGIRVVEVTLLTEFRCRGIGTLLLGALLAEATATGQPVLLSVERRNPALRLYHRLGFTVVGEQGAHLQARWTPAEAQATTAS